MKVLQNARAQLAAGRRRDGPAHARALGRRARRPAQQLVLGSDPAGRRRALRHGLPSHRGRLVPAHPARSPGHVPRAGDACSADVGLLKWGQPRWRDELLERHGVDYARTPAEDFATGIVTYRNPETDAAHEGAVHGLVDVRQAGTAAAHRRHRARATRSRRTRLRSPLEIFIGDARRRRRSPTPSSRSRRRPRRSGLLAIQPNEPDLYGYTDENVDALAAFRDGRVGAARLRLRPRDRPAHDGRVPLGRTGPRRRPHRRRDARRRSTTTCRSSSRAGAPRSCRSRRDPWVALSDAQPTGHHRGRHQRREPRRTPHARGDRGHARCACFDAGAAIVHNHIDIVGDARRRGGRRYLEGGSRSWPNGPTRSCIPPSTASAITSRGSAHIAPLARSRASSASASSIPVR